MFWRIVMKRRIRLFALGMSATMLITAFSGCKKTVPVTSTVSCPAETTAAATEPIEIDAAMQAQMNNYLVPFLYHHFILSDYDMNTSPAEERIRFTVRYTAIYLREPVAEHEGGCFKYTLESISEVCKGFFGVGIDASEASCLPKFKENYGKPGQEGAGPWFEDDHFYFEVGGGDEPYYFPVVTSMTKRSDGTIALTYVSYCWDNFDNDNWDMWITYNEEQASKDSELKIHGKGSAVIRPNGDSYHLLKFNFVPNEE